jgi:two-component system, OmpR family, response regulator
MLYYFSQKPESPGYFLNHENLFYSLSACLSTMHLLLPAISAHYRNSLPEFYPLIPNPAPGTGTTTCLYFTTGRLIAACNYYSFKPLFVEIADTTTHDPFKALIVDDEVDICFLLSGILRQQQLKPSFVNSLSAAKASLAADMPSILFLDNHLPDGFGLDFISYVRLHHPDVKIVMITAHDGLAERKKAQTEGADLFISKPFTREVIDYAVKKLLPA